MDYDCIVLGTGNAGICAAIAAAESGCNPKRILVIDKAPVEWAGGNSFFTAGAFRTVHGGLEDLLPVVRRIEKDESRLKRIDIDPYTDKQFTEDILRLGNWKSNRQLVGAVVEESRDVIRWLAENIGVRFLFSSHRQAYEIGGRLKFWGGVALAVQDGGKGLMEDLFKKTSEMGIQFRWNTTTLRLIVVEDQFVRGVEVQDMNEPAKTIKLTARGVIMASGGFEADKATRIKYMGPSWEKARVRGTPYNKGDGLKLVFELPQSIRPEMVGDLTGCHSTCWDFHSPPEGSRSMTNQYTKSGYPLGLMLNSYGQRYVDEGADFRSYTYALYGKATLFQPGGFAFQLWDSKTKSMLRIEEYADDITKRFEADTINNLAILLENEGMKDPAAFVKTVEEYNRAVLAFRKEYPEKKFDPAVRDGLGTQSSAYRLGVPKSNWALTMEEPPFIAVKVTCGITFTFGGIPINPQTAGVVAGGKQVDGLFCAGEMVGDLFWNNYPGGSGLTAGAVFGRKAGREVGRLVSESLV